jgi:integrase
MDRQTTPVEFAFSFIGSDSTRRQYSQRLKRFFDHIGIQGSSLEEQGRAFLAQAKSTKNNPDSEYWVEDTIMSYLDFHIKRFRKGGLASASLGSFYYPIRAFCDPYERELPNIGWKRLLKPVPAAKSYANDRAYQIEEIRKLVQHADRRTKVLVYVMCSSGIRVGGWEGLCWKHVEAKKNDKGEVIAAKLTVYNEDGDQYFTFITPEAYAALKEYMDYRASYGENITSKSPLIRDRFATKGKKSDGGSSSSGGGDDDNKAGNSRGGGLYGIATVAKALSVEGIRKALNRELRAQGLRGLLPEGETRHPVKQAHGFRKFFFSRAIGAGMIHDNVDYLIGHRSGNQASYFKPEVEGALLQDYLKAVDSLTINDNKTTLLQKEIAELKEKKQEENYIVLGKITQRDREVEELKRDVEALRMAFQASQVLIDYQEYQNNTLLDNDEMRGIIKEAREEARDEAKYINRLEEEAAEIVDPEMEVEFFVSKEEEAVAAAQKKKPLQQNSKSNSKVNKKSL